MPGSYRHLKVPSCIDQVSRSPNYELPGARFGLPGQSGRFAKPTCAFFSTRFTLSAARAVLQFVVGRLNCRATVKVRHASKVGRPIKAWRRWMDVSCKFNDLGR